MSIYLKGAPADTKNAKKKNSKKTNKNKSSVSRANKKKPGMPNVANDLSQKLYASMEKHKEVKKPSKSTFKYLGKYHYSKIDTF